VQQQTRLLDRPQVYPGSHETGSEGVPQRVPSDAIEPCGLVLPARRSECRL